MPAFKKYLLFAFVFALINAALLLVFFTPRFDTSSDTQQYVDTINFLAGSPDGQLIWWRILKPMPVLIGAVLSPAMSALSALVFQNIIFYFLSVYIIFLIIFRLYANEKQAFYGTVLFSAAYPVLQHGLVPITDLSGICFWLLSILIALNYLRKPMLKTAFLGGLVAGFAMLFKESLAIAPIFFTALVFIAGQGNFKEKLKPIIIFGLAFLVFPMLNSAVIYQLYQVTYWDWYNKAWEQPGGQGIGDYLGGPLRAVLEMVRVLFIGWFFALCGAVKEFYQRNKERGKILLALIFPSISFLLWSYPHNRIIFIAAAPLLLVLASRGILKNKKAEIFLLTSYVLINYLFLFFFLKYGYLLADKF